MSATVCTRKDFAIQLDDLIKQAESTDMEKYNLKDRVFPDEIVAELRAQADDYEKRWC